MKLNKLKLFAFVRCYALAFMIMFVLSVFAVDAKETKKANGINANSKAKAQKTDNSWASVAPFVNSQTPFVVQLDLHKLDLERTGESLKLAFNAYMENVGFDESSKERCAAAFAKTVDSSVVAGKASLEAFCSSVKLPRVYLVGFLTDDSIQVVGVVSAKGKSSSEREKLLELASDIDLELYEQGSDFVFSPNLDEEELDELLDGFQAESNDAMQKYFSDATATISAYVAKFPLGSILTENGYDLDELFDESQEEGFDIRSIWDLCENSFESAEFSFDLNELKSSASATFTDAQSATAVRKELETLIDSFATFFMELTEEDMDYEASFFVKNFGLTDLGRELTRASIRKALLPQVEGQQLIGCSIDLTDSSSISHSQGALFPVAGAAAVGFLIPAIQKAREGARHMQCINNLEEITLALQNYHDAFDAFPSSYTVDADGKPLHSWRVYLLPFVEQTELYNQIRLNEPWDSEWNSQFHSQMPDVFSCPSDSDAPEGTTRYALVVGEKTPFDKPSVVDKNGNISVKADGNYSRITDGSSNTLCIVERKKAVCWMDPTGDFDRELLENGFDQSMDDCLSSSHAGGANVGMFDGSVSFISESTSIELLKALGTMNGGEDLSNDDEDFPSF